MIAEHRTGIVQYRAVFEGTFMGSVPRKDLMQYRRTFFSILIQNKEMREDVTYV
jgi:hypothetical protein